MSDAHIYPMPRIEPIRMSDAHIYPMPRIEPIRMSDAHIYPMPRIEATRMSDAHIYPMPRIEPIRMSSAHLYPSPRIEPIRMSSAHLYPSPRIEPVELGVTFGPDKPEETVVLASSQTINNDLMITQNDLLSNSKKLTEEMMRGDLVPPADYNIYSDEGYGIDEEYDENLEKVTLRAALERALKVNPNIQQALENIRTFNARIAQAKAAKKPQVSSFTSLSSDYTTSDVGDSRFDNTTRGEAGLSLDLLIYDFGATRAQIDSARYNAEQAGFEFDRIYEELSFELISLYFEVIRQRRLLAIEKFRLEEHKKFLNLIKNAYETDQILASQLHIAEVGLAQKQQSIITKKREVFESEINLERIVKLDISNLALYKPESFSLELPDQEAFINYALENSPRIEALQKAVQSAEKNLEAIRSGRAGSINFRNNLSGDRIFEGDRDLEGEVSSVLEYRVSLFDGGNTSARIQEAESAVVQAKQDIEIFKLELTEQLKRAYMISTTAPDMEKYANLERSNALKVLKSFRGEVEHGTRSFTDILSQIDAVASARSRHLSVELSNLLANFAILRQQKKLLKTLDLASNSPRGSL